MIEKTGDRVTETTLHEQQRRPLSTEEQSPTRAPMSSNALIEEELTPWLEKTERSVADRGAPLAAR